MKKPAVREMTGAVNERAALQGIGPGRPRKNPPVDAAQRIADLAADGWSIVGIAWKLDVTKKTFYRWMEEDDALREAFEIGRERERHTLHNKLFRIAVESDGRDAILAAQTILNSRHGYRTDQQSDAAPRLSVTFNLPGAMSRDDFLKTVVSDERSS